MDEFYDWLSERLDDEGMSHARDVLDGYDRANREYRESAEARMSEYAASDAAMREDIQSLKARNYDLLMQVPSDDSPVVNQVDESGEVFHIDSLFKDFKETDHADQRR